MRKLIPAVIALFAAGACHALGFGELALRSALNQPLDATVELLAVKPSERGSLEVRIADPGIFERFGISRSPVLDDVQVEVREVPGSDRLRVRLKTQRPVREPFLTVLLEADWNGGRALREYTVLLDPPVETPATPPAQAPTRAERQPEPAASAPAEPETRTAAPAARESRPARPQTAAPTPPAQPEYRRYGPVAPDETLWSIAYELRPDPRISMDQMMLAIYQSNPQAFEGNINRLEAGTMLVIPDTEDIRAIDRAVASQEIADQKRAYASAQRGTRTAAAGSKKTEPAAAPAPAGETPPAQEGELRLEPPADEAGTAPAAAAGDEDAAAGERIAENAAATARALTEAAREAEESATAGGDETGTRTADAGTAAAPEEGRATTDPEEDETAAAAGEGTAAPAEEATAPAGDETAQPPAEGAVAETTAEPETAAPAESSEAAGQPPAAEPETAAPASDAAPARAEGAAPEAAAPEEPSAGESVAVGAESVIPEGTAGLVTPRNLLIALAGLLLVVATAMWLRRRQYKPVPADFSAQVAAGGTAAAEPALAEPIAQPSADSPDEVIADADSYIEHELYDEALAALRVGLEQFPGDRALRRKVLEVHYAAGARDAFVTDAEEYFPSPADDDPDWRAVAAMGRELAPDEPLFAGADRAESDMDRSFEAFFGEEDTGGPAREPARTAPADDDWPASEAEPFGAGLEEPETSEEPEEEAGDADAVAEGDLDFAWSDDEATTGTRAEGDDLASLAEDFDTDTSESETAGTGGERREDAGKPAEAGPPTLDIDLADFDLGSEEDAAAETAADEDDRSGAAGDEDEFAEFDFDSLSLDDEREPSASGQAAGSGLDDLDRAEEGSAETAEFEASEGLSLDEDPFRDEPPAKDTEDSSPEADRDEFEETPPAGADEETVAPDTGDEGEPGSDSDEVTTKLDLARAYLDMGEPDMARGLLEEVRDQGDAEQRREAEDLLERAG